MKLKTAVIGTGNMGKNHVRIYSELPESELVAVCDVSESGKELADKFGCKFYQNYNEMLEKEKPDAVSICVPTGLHHKIGMDVIGKGVNTLIEKPIASEIKQAEELVNLADEKKIKLAVGHVERFNPAVQKLKEIVDHGKLGEITSIVARRVGLFPPQIKDANVVIDLAVHDVDIFNYMLGKKPADVFISKGKAIAEREDYADIILRYEGNVNCFLQVNWITPVKIRNLSITGTKGYAELNYITQELIFYKSNYKKDYDSFGDFVVKFGSPEKENIKVKKDEPLKLELKNFLESISQDGKPLVTGEDALSTLRVLLESENEK